MRSFYNRVYNKANKTLDKLLVSHRSKKINNTDFSIICNNCWAGFIYRRYGLPYLTPTVGVYLFPGDFLRLCADLKGYMEKELEFIPYTESKYRELIEERNQTEAPIGRLGDVEIVFLHYKTKEEAEEKWKRRAARINYNNLIFKFSKMNGCTEQELKQFDQLDCNKKFCFVPPADAGKVSCAVPYKSANGQDEINNDTSEYARYINVEKLINSRYANGLNMR